YFNKGIMFGIDELATDFKVYEKVAWSKKQYGAYRCNYYILLLNNAYSASKWGSAIYYAEKAKKQGEIDNYPRLFIDFTVKMSIYSNTGEVERIIKAYEENQNTIEHFGSKIAEKPEKYYMEGRDLLPIFELDNPELFYQYKAQLELIKGNLEKANEFLNKSLDESFKNNIKLAGEIDDLLYAQTEAEHHKLALEKSEIEKKERNTWIIAISLLLVIITIGGIILLRLKDRKLKKTLKSLDETADIQIALMKQFETEVRKEEQERISQNLHDDLAGILAAVKNNVDLQVEETNEIEKKQKLVQLSEMIQVAFHKVRNKSHDLFDKAQLPGEEMFCQYI